VKRFSRSDELTRHSRIHNNPNSRRGAKQQAAAAAAAAAVSQMAYDPASALMHQQLMGPGGVGMHMNAPMANMQQMMPPPAPMAGGINRSSSVSQVNSPNMSPSAAFQQAYPTNGGSYMTRNASGDFSPAAMHPAMDINLLATAASQVEREHTTSSPAHLVPTPSSRGSYAGTPYNYPAPFNSNGRLSSLSSYHYPTTHSASQPMSRSASHEREDPYTQHRPTKRSRPGSPNTSTAPPSPSFSHHSASPTPDHTPLTTPPYSPRLRPYYTSNGVQLPTLHHLSLQNQVPPVLAPIEPSADGQQPYVPTQHSGLRISEIVERQDGNQRVLPSPLYEV